MIIDRDVKKTNPIAIMTQLVCLIILSISNECFIHIFNQLA